MTCCEDKFYLGFRECQDEVIRYLVEVEGWDAKEKLCNRLMAHLASSSEKFLHTGEYTEHFNEKLDISSNGYRIKLVNLSETKS